MPIYNKMPNKSVIFDLFGTLYQTTDPEAEIIKEFNLKEDYNRIENAVCGYRFDNWENYLKKIAETANIPCNLENRKKIRRIMLSEAKGVLETLKKEGFILGLISNAYPDCRSTLIENRLIDYFDAKGIFLSYEVGMTKQNLEIFRYCLRDLGVDAQNAVVVGDSLRSDIQGAFKATRGKMGGILIAQKPSKEQIVYASKESHRCIIAPNLREVPNAVELYFSN